jgi:glycerol-3-phosphate acyltransferase PlsY
MKGLEILVYILPVIMGYLLGSVLPGYFLPLWVKKMDIRQMGDGNPGIVNVRRNAGLALSFFTGLYDVPKGLLSLFIVLYIFKLPLFVAYLAGFAAVLGHKFPFYLGFKGGRGIAATVGLFLYVFVRILVQEFALLDLFPFFIYIALYALCLSLSTHGKGDLFTVTIFPLMGIYMLLHLGPSADLVLFLALAVVMTAESGRNLRRDGIIFSGGQPASWRTLLRPFALLFIPLGVVLTGPALLLLTGCLLALSFLFDLSRLLFPRLEAFSQAEIRPGFRFCRPSESGRLSSMTVFLFGVFICFLWLDRQVAFAAIGFVSLGGLFAAVVEMNFGQRRLFAQAERTLEGSLAFLAGALTIAFFLWSVGWLTLPAAVLGVLAAALAAAVPAPCDEGLVVPLLSGAVMSLL